MTFVAQTADAGQLQQQLLMILPPTAVLLAIADVCILPRDAGRVDVVAATKRPLGSSESSPDSHRPKVKNSNRTTLRMVFCPPHPQSEPASPRTRLRENLHEIRSGRRRLAAGWQFSFLSNHATATGRSGGPFQIPVHNADPEQICQRSTSQHLTSWLLAVLTAMQHNADTPAKGNDAGALAGQPDSSGVTVT